MAQNLKRIVWLASYPKSGNTWLRAFLANLLSESDKPVHINDIHLYCSGDMDAKYYPKKAVDTLDPYHAIHYREKGLTNIVKGNDTFSFVKTHCPWRSYRGQHYFPDQFNAGAIYITRNPLDIIPSMINHFGDTPEEAITRFFSDKQALGNLDNHTWSYMLGSWMSHVHSWIGDRKPFPLMVLRYEDLLSNPEQAFAKVVQFTNIGASDKQVKKAVEFSSFPVLQTMEKEAGFIEQAESDKFFNYGQAKAGRNLLSDKQRMTIVERSKGLMKSLGYL